jgi:enolase
MGGTDSTHSTGSGQAGSPQATIIVGDDLLVTNIKRIQTAIEKNAVNAVLIKPNQIGTITEAIEAVMLTKKQGWKPFASHRSGETTDTFIADLAVGLSCPLIKSGALARGERVCKYNRLMEIEKTLKK